VAQPLALLAPALVARLLVVGVLLRQAEDAGVVALALEAAQSRLQRLVRTDLDSDHSWVWKRSTAIRTRQVDGLSPAPHVSWPRPSGRRGGAPYRMPPAAQWRTGTSMTSSNPGRTIELLGVIERFTFRNPDTGWA